MSRQLWRALSSSWTWALGPTLFVCLLIHPPPGQDVLDAQYSSVDPLTQIVYVDLDGDSLTEFLRATPGEPLNTLPILSADGLSYHEQWNLPDKFIDGLSTLHFGDSDMDGKGEIYVLTARADSVFLNIWEPFETGGIRRERRFIARVGLRDGEITSMIKPIGFFDVGGDGSREYYFAITTGFGLWPRACYRYDVANDSLLIGPFTGVNFNKPYFADLDGDGRPEILSEVTAAGNYTTPIPLTDYSCWLMVLDDHLRFTFPPVEFPGFGGRLSVLPGPKSDLLAVYDFRGGGQPVNAPGIYRFALDGKPLGEKSFEQIGISQGIPVLMPTPPYKIAIVGNPIQVLDENLNPERQIVLPFQSYFDLHSYDVDGTGSPERLMYSTQENLLLVCDNDFRELARSEFDIPGDWKVSNGVFPGNRRSLLIQSGRTRLELGIVHNPLYWLAWWVYPAIYGGFVLLIWVTRKANTRQVEKRTALRHQLLSLQLKSINSQLDPHFTFNALNSISSFLYTEDRKAAYDALNIFSRLLRQLLNDADKVFRTLEEEIDFVNRYLSLEKLRFGTRFEYHITVDPALTRKELVPKMSLQTFAENAIRHGLVPKGSGGELSITIAKEADGILIVVEDNGIGRKKAAEQQPVFGRGLKISHEFYDILSAYSRTPIVHAIIDLTDETGKARGTRVEVRFPANLTPEILDSNR